MTGVAIAIGIAALSMTAYPSEAATASLGMHISPQTPATGDLSNTVTVSGSGSIWDYASEYGAQDGDSNYTNMGDHPANYSGPGTFPIYWPFHSPFPADGHRYDFYVMDFGHFTPPPVNNSDYWNVFAGTGSIVNNGGTITISEQ